MTIKAKADLGSDAVLQSEKESPEVLLSLFHLVLFMVNKYFCF